MSTPMTSKPALLYPIPAPPAQQKRSSRRGLLLLTPSLGNAMTRLIGAREYQKFLTFANFSQAAFSLTLSLPSGIQVLRLGKSARRYKSFETAPRRRLSHFMEVIRATFGPYENPNRGGYEKLELIENKGRKAVLIAEISAIRLDSKNRIPFLEGSVWGVFWRAVDWASRVDSAGFSSHSLALTKEGHCRSNRQSLPPMKN